MNDLSLLSNPPLLPREKIQQLGAKALSNEELLALILGSGTQNCDVFELSRRLSNFLSSAATVPTVESLLKIRGLGKVKASQVLACLELSARYILSDKTVAVKTPEDLVARLSYLKFEPQEHLVLVSLDSANSVIRVHELTTGLANQTPVHPREAFVRAIEDRAVAVIFVHNHPSGNTEPSPEDYGITRVLCAAGKIIQIPVIDHIIVGKKGFTSLCRETPEIFESNL
ncbi:DNA repair protein RadC [Fibrobacter sp.]|uniref:RadC family protein n=1 Tax=Fibrobacter sp. TaxID=35828 RepID=UPI00388E6FB9